MAIRAALLGATFPSNLLADIGGYDRDSIDDMLDAAGELFEEVEFNKGMNTWLYAFKPSRRRKEQNKRAANVVYQEGVLAWARENNESFQSIAKSTGAYMERFLVPTRLRLRGQDRARLRHGRRPSAGCCAALHGCLPGQPPGSGEWFKT